MANISFKALNSALPFHNFSPNQIVELFQSKKDNLFEILEKNNFSKDMLKHVNGFSKDNFTCGYFQENSFLNLLNKHLPEGLKAFHLNIVSFKKNGVPLSHYLKSLNTIFDIICLTEIRQHEVGMFIKEFPDHHIFIDKPVSDLNKSTKGGVALILRKNKFDNITELDLIKLSCNCSNCKIENKWL